MIGWGKDSILTFMRNYELDRGLTPQIRDRIKSAVMRNFGNDYVYAATSGSIIFGGVIPHQSDIDMLVVLRDSVRSKPKQELLSQARGFVNDYLNIHLDFEFEPDTTFPGEYITQAQVEDAVAGRGYHVGQENQLFLPQASEAYYLEDPEHWYRSWLSMTAYGEFISGDRTAFLRNKQRAWNTLILFNSLRLNKPISANSMIDYLSTPADKWAGSGISERYLTFREHELPFTQRALEDLSVLGYFTANDGNFTPNTDRIAEWHAKTVQLIKDKSIRKADLLIDLNETMEIRTYAEERWNQIKQESIRR